jgi:hypothetical protein
MDAPGFMGGDDSPTRMIRGAIFLNAYRVASGLKTSVNSAPLSAFLAVSAQW